MGLELTEPPEEPLLTDEEALAQVRSDEPKDAEWIALRVLAATEAAERATNRRFLTQEWKLTRDAFPGAIGPRDHREHRGFVDQGVRAARAIILPYPPLASVEAVKYLDVDGVERTLDPSKYIVRTGETPGEIVPAFGESWPATRCIEDAVRVEFTCGYGGPEDVPALLKAAVALIVGTLYANRETVAPVEMREIPFTARWLLEKFEVKRWRSS